MAAPCGSGEETTERGGVESEWSMGRGGPNVVA
jgi:hypothetical protein